MHSENSAEEVGLTAFEPQLVARLFFSDVEDLNILVYVFVTDQFDGEPHETTEARPIWVDVKDVPYEKMWEDDQYWLPQVLNGESVDGYFRLVESAWLAFALILWGMALRQSYRSASTRLRSPLTF